MVRWLVSLLRRGGSGGGLRGGEGSLWSLGLAIPIEEANVG